MRTPEKIFSTDAYRQLCERARLDPPRVALVLGSGLGELVQRVRYFEEVPFAAVPGLEPPTVPGHQGRVILGKWAGKSVLVFAGRLHLYEGHSRQKVAEPVHIARRLGAEILILTNAAGGIRDDLVPGTLLALSDHLEWTRSAQAFTLPSPYDAGLIESMQDAARKLDARLTTGTYAQVTGPCYETPAEIRALRSLGVDAVGMSTAHEAQVGFDLGLRCLAVSCITNRAAGLGTGPIHHEEVLDRTSQAKERLGELFEEFLQAPR